MSERARDGYPAEQRARPGGPAPQAPRADNVAGGDGPLSGIRVLELGSFVAGPFAGGLQGVQEVVPQDAVLALLPHAPPHG